MMCECGRPSLGFRHMSGYPCAFCYVNQSKDALESFHEHAHNDPDQARAAGTLNSRRYTGRDPETGITVPPSLSDFLTPLERGLVV